MSRVCAVNMKLESAAGSLSKKTLNKGVTAICQHRHKAHSILTRYILFIKSAQKIKSFNNNLALNGGLCAGLFLGGDQ